MVVYLNKKPISPVVFLAPLAGITDLPFRNLVSRFGAGLVVSEMIASQEMVQAKVCVKKPNLVSAATTRPYSWRAARLIGCQRRQKWRKTMVRS